MKLTFLSLTCGVDCLACVNVGFVQWLSDDRSIHDCRVLRSMLLDQQQWVITVTNVNRQP
jgi:hypothetical protein